MDINEAASICRTASERYEKATRLHRVVGWLEEPSDVRVIVDLNTPLAHLVGEREADRIENLCRDLIADELGNIVKRLTLESAPPWLLPVPALPLVADVDDIPL
jgi:hypothetical protein